MKLDAIDEPRFGMRRLVPRVHRIEHGIGLMHTMTGPSPSVLRCVSVTTIATSKTLSVSGLSPLISMSTQIRLFGSGAIAFAEQKVPYFVISALNRIMFVACRPLP
jgi:hypothetical protein